MLEKRKEYKERLLNELKALEQSVLAVRDSNSLPFSFFSESFNRMEKMSRMIHELELLQINEMKSQMERLVLFLSETESSKNAASGLKNGEDAQKLENSLKDSTVAEEISSDKSAVQSSNSRKTFFETREKSRPYEGNKFAKGIVFPEYKNPRTSGATQSFEEPKPSPSEKVSDEKKTPLSLNDVIKAPPTVLDLKRSISLNDRFLFQRELFNNNRDEMNDIMSSLNEFKNYKDAEKYLAENCKWNFEDKNVKEFLRVIKKVFE
ncbi:MAG: hypothetical protein PHN86_08985 [Proteiniphilum sp.]|nr:hypothetical protein [Proteiniphilum sp.]